MTEPTMDIEKLELAEVEELFERCGWASLALRRSPPEIRNNPELVLLAIKADSSSLDEASDELKNDVAFVFEAVRVGNGMSWDSFEYASDEIKNNREAVLNICSFDERCLRCAPDKFRKDEEFVKQISALANERSNFTDEDWAKVFTQ